MKRLRKASFTALFIFSVYLVSYGQAPDSSGAWQMYKTPAEAGFDVGKLSRAKAYYDSIGTESLMVIKGGKVVIAWGDYERQLVIHSCRKSFISALFGIYIHRGLIDPNEKIGDLDLSFNTPLTESEQEARIIDLLRARSGIYIPAGAEAPHMKKTRPKRGSHPPGTFWYYNNWDFNVLGSIFKLKTGKDVFTALKEDIYDLIGAEDFDLSDGSFETQGGRYTDHPPYVMKMSARDMARFGWVFANGGRWEGKQIIPEDWVKESIRAYTSELNAGYQAMGGYGYMWWVPQDDLAKYGAFEAAGAGGHYITVLPGLDMVFVHRVDTYIPGNKVSDKARRELYTSVLAAYEGGLDQVDRFEPLPALIRSYSVKPLEHSSPYLGSYEMEFGLLKVSNKGEELYLELPFRQFKYKLSYIGEEQFIIDDMSMLLSFKKEDGQVSAVTFDFKGVRVFSGNKKY